MSQDTPTLTRRKALAGIGSVAGMTSLAGCGSVLGKSESLRYGQVLAPTTLDPIVAADPWSGQAAAPVFDGLYAYDARMNLVPVLADGQPTVSDDGTTYRVTLKRGPTFHDGRPVRAADAAYSLDPATYRPPRAPTPSPNLWAVSPIEQVRVEDDRTVAFDLSYPYPAFEQVLTRPVVPKAVREQTPKQFGTSTTVGSGPYEVQSFSPGTDAVLRARPDGWRDASPGIRRVTFVQNHAGLARSMSLKTGQNDVVERVHPKLWSATKQFPDSRVVSEPSYHSYFLGFNASDGPTAKRSVREAIDYLLPMDELVNSLVGEAGQRQYGPLPHRLARAWNFPVERWADVPHDQDLEAARRLLQEADVGNWSPVVAVTGDKVRETFGEAIVHELRELGFRKARTKKYSWSAFREAILSGDASKYAMFVGSWAGLPDPDSFLYPLFHENMEGLTNATFYRDPDLMKHLQGARETRDRPTRKRLYESAIGTLLDERVHLPIATLSNSFGVKDRVEGFDPHPLAEYNPQLVAPDGATMSLTE